LMLTILGFQMEFGGLKRTFFSTRTAAGPEFGGDSEEERHKSRSGGNKPLCRTDAVKRSEDFNAKAKMPIVERGHNMGSTPMIRLGGTSHNRVAGSAEERRSRRSGGFGAREGSRYGRRRTW